MVNKVAFVGFTMADHLLDPPLVRSHQSLGGWLIKKYFLCSKAFWQK